MIQAYLSMVKEVNESQRRQKESLRADINRKKKQLDDIDQKRGQTEDTYQSDLLACRAEMSLFAPHTFEHAQLERKLRAAFDSYQFTMQRLTIRFLSTEIKLSKSNIIPWDGSHMKTHIS